MNVMTRPLSYSVMAVTKGDQLNIFNVHTGFCTKLRTYVNSGVLYFCATCSELKAFWGRFCG